MPRPPETRAEHTPWPTYPLMYRVASAHEEGGERLFSVNTERFVGADGKVTALKAHEVEMKSGRFEKVEGSDFELEADLVLLAMGFVGPEKPGLLTDLGVDLNERGNVARSAKWATNVDGVFVAGDMGRRTVADRVGHRRGSLGGRCGRCVPRGRVGAAVSDRDHHRPAAVAVTARTIRTPVGFPTGVSVYRAEVTFGR